MSDKKTELYDKRVKDLIVELLKIETKLQDIILKLQKRFPNIKEEKGKRELVDDSGLQFDLGF